MTVGKPSSQQSLMFKQSGTAASTKVLRKIKANESIKQGVLNKGKIMLTDLCPEEKAKVGQLVRTLEVRKNETRNLEQKIRELQEREEQFICKIEELQKIVSEQRIKQMQYKEQITLAKVKEQEKQRYIQHLLDEKDEVKQKQKIVPCVEQFAMTEPVILIQQGCQVNQKKKKHKTRSTQTETELNIRLKQNGRRNNSKSFEKIMKRPMIEGGHDSFKQSKAKSAIRISDEDYEEEGFGQTPHYTATHLNEEEEGQEDFDELAKKWLQLKERNMSKIKESLKKSKQRASSASGGNRSAHNIHKEIEYPRGFDQEENIGENIEENGSQNEYDDSFGPHKQKKGKINQFQIQEPEFDELELNKILKSKNFSASRLVHKNRLDSQDSSRRRSMESEEPKNVHKKGNLYGGLGNKPMKNSAMSNSQNIDFYETDLLDIVNSIQP